MFPVFVCRASSLILISLFTTFITSAAEKKIRLRNPISPSDPAIQTQRLTPAPASGLFVIQFHDPLKPEWREQLAQAGVTLLRYVPDDAFVAKLRGGQLEQIRALSFVQFVGAYRAEQKMAPASPWRSPTAGSTAAIPTRCTPTSPGRVTRAVLVWRTRRRGG
jgi:hypothetical protein